MSKIWYVLTIDSAVIERDKSVFEEALSTTWKLWYEYLQNVDNNEISSYYSITLMSIDEKRIEDVKRLYSILPNERRIRWENEWVYYTFFLSQSVNVKLAHKLADNLSQLYQSPFYFHTLYSENSKIEVFHKEAITPRAIWRIFVQRNLTDSVNEWKLRIVNDYKIEQIQSLLSRHEDFDDVLNRVPWYWTAFEYVYDILWSVTSAYRFFNEHFDAWFRIEEWSISDYLRDWVPVWLSWSGIVEDKWVYFVLTQKWEEKQITDFTIRVHYKIIRDDNVSYIVSLMNQSWFEVNRIEWKNTTSEQAVADFIQKFWPFHFLWTKDHIKKVHWLISNTEVPIVYWYQYFGANEYKGNQILLLPDWVFDITTTKYFPKDEETGIYFMWWNDWMMYTPPIATAVPNMKNLLHMNISNVYWFDDYLWVTKRIYRDDSAWMIWMIACSMAWYMLYAPRDETPLYFLTWPTGTGKSTFADILALWFWVQSLYSIWQSTVYWMRVLLSSMNRMPAFMTEYRSSMQYKEQKDELLRLTFDRWVSQRWRQNWDLITYTLWSQVFLEWEDMYSSWSIRTRTIVHKTKKSWRMDGVDVKKIIADNSELISTFIWSYAMTVSKSNYMKAYNEARDILYIQWVEPRIIDNFCTFYAGSVAFAPQHKDTLIEKMKALILEQQADYNENGQHAQIIKILGQYVANKLSSIYIQWNNILISWDDVITFCTRERKKMDLSEDANYWLLIDYWFEWWMFEVQWTSEWDWKDPFMINWLKIHISKCPDKLFTNKKIYNLFINYKKTLWAN